MDEAINNVINNIAEKLGIAVEYIVPSFARYNIAGCLIDLIKGFLLLIPIFVLIKIGNSKIKIIEEKYKTNPDYKSYDYHDDKFNTFVIFGIPSIILGLFSTISIFSGLDILKWIISPEGATMAYILDKVKSLK